MGATETAREKEIEAEGTLRDVIMTMIGEARIPRTENILVAQKIVTGETIKAPLLQLCIRQVLMEDTITAQ